MPDAGGGSGGGSSEPGFSSIFQSPGGPPLILVCIAAGLLLGAFIGVLLMRRMRPVVVNRVNGRPLKPPVKLGEKPKLLDIYIVPRSQISYESDGPPTESTGGAGNSPWAHVSSRSIQPFAALYLPAPEDQTTPEPLPPPAAPSLTSRILERVKRSASHGAHALHVSHAVPPSLPLREVQLAVTVTMPSPSRTGGPTFGYEKAAGTGKAPLKSAHDHDRFDDPHESPMPDCCIGTVVVSYRPDPEADSQPTTSTTSSPSS